VAVSEMNRSGVYLYLSDPYIATDDTHRARDTVNQSASTPDELSLFVVL
jgi:hypothetical protein